MSDPASLLRRESLRSQVEMPQPHSAVLGASLHNVQGASSALQAYLPSRQKT